MILIENTVAYKTYLVQKQFDNRVRELATLLITALYIDSSSRSLVAACGKPGAPDNATAVYHWVRQQACCASCIMELDLKTVQKRLVRLLLDKTDQQEYVE